MRKVVGLTLAVVLTMAGTGACAFEPRSEAGAGGIQRVDAAVTATGASAAPGPGSPVPASSTPAQTPQKVATDPPPTTKSPAPTTKPASKPSSTGCPQGDKQRDTEKYLAQLGEFGSVTVDGVQSNQDCAAIKKFQKRYGISPANGRAGPTTADVARRLASTRTDQCQTGSAMTICVNLTLQTFWVLQGGRVVMKPTIIRSGKPGYATPTGTYTIASKNIREWSDPYKVWMPYWQRFNGGIGFHQTVSYIHEKSIGSHGCVNLLPSDARTLWGLTKVGTRVYVFGHRPGT